MVTYCLLEPNPATNKTQRHADYEPDHNQCEHGSERHRTAGSLGPNEEIEEEKGAENDSRDQQRGHDNVALPSLATERFVDSCRNIATDCTEYSRDQKNSGCQETTVGG